MKYCFLVGFLVLSLASPYLSRAVTGRRSQVLQHPFCGTYPERIAGFSQTWILNPFLSSAQITSKGEPFIHTAVGVVKKIDDNAAP
jgi:hypothetical protein